MQANSVFALVKERIKTLDAVHRYLPGADIRRQGNRYSMPCPFHADKEPSLVIFPDGGWKCFGCGAGGSVVDFAAEVLRIQPLEAARALARDFGLPVADVLTPEEKRRIRVQTVKRQREAEAERLFEQRINEAHQKLCLIIRTTSDALARVLERGDAQAAEDLAGSVKHVPYLEFLADCLWHPKVDIRLEALKEARRWVM